MYNDNFLYSKKITLYVSKETCYCLSHLEMVNILKSFIDQPTHIYKIVFIYLKDFLLVRGFHIT